MDPERILAALENEIDATITHALNQKRPFPSFPSPYWTGVIRGLETAVNAIRREAIDGES